ncbi:hypothetical protein PQQ86_32525 [Paraburkholderia sediminicola]|uniref:hypothetical protein n=1 Tax=Paraburkholderia sediminicola TaxID=458836 RepID=UPI0038BD8F32
MTTEFLVDMAEYERPERSHDEVDRESSERRQQRYDAEVPLRGKKQIANITRRPVQIRGREQNYSKRAQS